MINDFLYTFKIILIGSIKLIVFKQLNLYYMGYYSWLKYHIYELYHVDTD